MRHIKYFFILLIVAVMGCEEEGRIDFIAQGDEIPQQILNITAKSTPGGAILYYDLPDDDNLLYAMVRYEAPAGVAREAKASTFVDSLLLEGFADTMPHEVEIITIGKNQKVSEPIVQTITPLQAPVISAFDDLELGATFGGVFVKAKCPTEANLVYTVLVDSLGNGDWITLDKFYTSQTEDKFVVRGLDTQESNFAVFINDRWGNKSDTLSAILTPLYEILIPTTKFTDLKFPNDSKWLSTKYPTSKLWDGVALNKGNFWATDQNGDPLPKWITIDFGDKYTLSRLKAWDRKGYEYIGRFPQNWEIYGSNDPNPDGSWESWTKIATFGGQGKPSGLPLYQKTSEDTEFAAAGYEFELDEIPAAYRYFRIKFIETLSGEEFVLIAEIEFYGQDES